MINAQLPDGTTLQFPDGTPDAVVNSTVKDHVAKQPGGVVETPESKMGFSPAPPEPPPPPDPYAAPPSGEATAPAWMTQTIGSPGKSLDWPTLDFHPFAGARPGAWGRIGNAVQEGWEGAPAIPLAPTNAPAGILNPFATGINTLLGIPGAVFRGLQQTGQEAIDPMAPNLGRTVASMPEALIPGIVPYGVQEYRPRVNPVLPRPVGSYYGEGTPANPFGSETLAQQTVRLVREADQDRSGGPGGQVPQPPGAQPPPAFVPPGTSAWPADTPRAVDAGPRQGDVLAPGTPLPSQPGTSTGAMRPAFVPPTVQAAAADARTAPPPTPPPGGGTAPPAGTGYARTPGVAMPADDMEREARGWYSPADEQAAKGATINTDAANGILKPLLDALPSDPAQAAARGPTPLTQLAKDMAPYQNQPMTYATAMELDTRLTHERRAAAASPGGGAMARQIGIAQDGLRDRMYALKDTDTTGDPTALANLPNARQAWNQSIKQRQLDDIEYDTGLRPEDKQNAYRRQRVTSMLQSDKQMATWAPDERAALETSLKSGQPGWLTNVGLSLVKPVMTTTGGTLGHAVAGVPGAIVGSHAGSELGTTVQGRLRNRLSQMTLDPVSQVLTGNMPPPPP